jgi:DNA-directed RNA polymerase specialized sigma24 family protein
MAARAPAWQATAGLSGVGANARTVDMDGTAAGAASNLDELLGHGDVLLRYAVIRVGDRSTAEDLVQDTLVAGAR